MPAFAPPIVLVEAGGIPITLSEIPDLAAPYVVVGDLAPPYTLVEAGGKPVVLLNPDGSLWTPPEEP